ncbi:Non-hem dioxygenase N-terminal domain [Dillenia turbinata]|uniref:Non-hem dioxygenase N-terminal domain n=1 Tax=Dillenia turbinata TaxID=194707 RepID=A0AAN8UN82_9MAGN
MGSTPEQEVNFGKSLMVPCVQELARQPITNIPPRYIRADDDRSIAVFTPSVPVIDLQRLLHEDPLNSEMVKLHSACKEWGFFQIVNHGVNAFLLEKFKTEVGDFFKLPYEEKKKLWHQPNSLEGFGQHFVVSEEQKLDWNYIHIFMETELYITVVMSSMLIFTICCRETLEAYSLEAKNLAMTILTQMAKALGMKTEEMTQLFNDGMQSMRMNYYPPCPEPDIAIGLTPHSDADALTILYQLNDTEGLQIRKDGKWIPVKPLEDAFVINIGDIMEIVSNGVYKSIEHRAIVNSAKERLSVATFYNPKLDSELGPASSLINHQNQPVFRRMPLELYFKEFFARKLSGKSYLDFVKIENAESDSF